MTVYLDHAAASPLRTEVLDAMLPHLRGDGANPSSPHGPGRRARMALDEAHERLAGAIGAQPRELVLTSGGTESVNLAVKGAAWAGRATGPRLVTTSVEHKSVLEAYTHLEHWGFETT
ncbi:MAG TPA: aminotransferase class V-fold PLP-dependent enzyme, partial [Candidatus Limnocylindrales bacterium]